MIKRSFDFSAALLGLILLAPFLLVLLVLLKVFEGGDILFVQERVGRGGRPFRIFKLRTMIANAQARGAAITVGGDTRITRLGRFLRRYKLDELPQLWNVMRGDMSLVGPRPELARFVEFYTPHQRQVLELIPGITDPASFAFFDEAELLRGVADPERYYRDQIMAEKIRINLNYAGRATFLTDFVLILATVARAMRIQFDLFRWLGIERPNLKAGS